MKINVNTGKRTLKMRILSAFMAVLIFGLTFTNLIGQLGIRVKADDTLGHIHNNTTNKVSQYKNEMNTNKGSTGSAYTYTGKYTNDNTITMFDYVSDYELSGTYNNCRQDESGYTDVFTSFNNTISDSGTLVSAASSNVTIVFDYSGTTFKASDEIYVHMWYQKSNGNTEGTTTWPGKKMSYDGVNNQFTYTFNPATLGFNPNSIIFSENGSYQTDNIVLAERTSAGHKYIINKDGLVEDSGAQVEIECVLSTAHVGDKYIYLFDSENDSTKNAEWPGEKMTYKSTSGGYDTYTFSFESGKYNCFIVNNGVGWQIPTGMGNQKQFHSKKENYAKSCYKYTFNESWTNSGYSSAEAVSAECTHGSSLPIKNTKYTIPLYFGNFWKDNAAGGYSSSNTPAYNNFYWQSNMGLKPYDTNGSASTQNLVGNNLSGPDDEDAKGNLLDVNHCTYNADSSLNDELELPYFSKTWAENNKTSDNKPLIRYYDEDVVGGNITFPFYEVYKEHNSTGRYERYYQFDSREANLKFNIQNTNDINNHKGYFSESDTDIVRHWWDGDTYINYTKGDRSNVGFFPFNENNNGESENTNAHNLGFGMKMEMDFQLEADGCVKVMNKDSNDKLTDIEGDGVQRVPTIFEFTGDDDLWVFIDGNLVLDMGGDHFKSHGKIDFYNKTATVDSAIDFTAGSGHDDLGVTPSSNVSVNSSSSPTFLSLLSGHNFDPTNPNKYDTTTTHTLTVFYMERGIMDSNLLIRFNYSPIPNNSRMKIAEVTKFDNVNEGLKNATQRAAEGDVFKYTVTNKLPLDISQVAIETPLSSGAKYPELGSYTRTAEGNSSWTTALTPNGTGTAEDKLFVNGEPGVETYVKDTAYWWVDGFSNGSWLVGKTTPQSGSDNGGDLWLMYGTADILYGDSKRGVESSAEFEKQFTRNSTMKVVQGDNLYRLPARDVNGHTTLFNDSGQLQAVEQTGTGGTQSRTVSDYYSTNYRLIDRNNNDLTSSNDLNNTKTFSFNNDTSVNDSFAVMLTEFVENTVKVGAITIKKQKPNDDSIPSDKEFTIKVRFEDIFGVEEVDADNETDYTGIKYKVYDSSGTLVNGDGTMTSGTVKVTEGGNEVEKYCGTFKLKVGQTATIEGIPYKTKYIVYENEPKYAPTYDNNNSTVLVGTIDDSSHKAVPLNSTTPNNNNITVTNFSHTLTIKEVTDFSTVNAGLISYTKTAAENDVFKYTVKNNSNVNGANSWIPVATYDTYQRQANGASSPVVFSGRPLQYEEIDDVDHVYLDVSQDIPDGHWYDVDPVFVAWLYNANPEEGVAVEFSYVSENLYKVDPGDYQNIAILRVYKNQIQTDWGNEWINHIWETRKNNSDKVYLWGRIDPRPLTKGYTYIPTDFNNVSKVLSKDNYKYGFTYIATPHKIQTSNIIYDYSYNNFIHDSSDYVKNVNYEWVDEFAAKTSGTTNDLLAGTTDNTGSFYLMHGETNATNGGSGDHESSANFYNQFARGSTMTVVQDGTLTSPNGGSPDTLKDNNQRGASTSLGDYYTTTKTLEGSTTGSPLATNTNSFIFDNNNNSNQSIHITETFTNTVKNGAISVQKKIENDEPTTENFTFKITLEDVFGVDSADVDSTGYGNITISGTNNANGKLTNDGQFTIPYNGTAKITGIPVGTKYTIKEIPAPASGFEFDSSGSSKYSGTVKAYRNESDQTPHADNEAVIQNKRKSTSSTEIILKKTAKEQVGTTNIGDSLANAQFKLVKVNGSSDDNSLRFTLSTVEGKNTYSLGSNSASYNNTNYWLTTGSDGKLTIEGLSPGDYYLEEQTAPAGFVATDSNNVVNGTAQNKRVYFSVGENTSTINLTCSDEMKPAYIKLYEHINEWRPTEWGDPTFIFKIRDTDSNKTSIVALTVDDDDTLNDKVLSGSVTGKTFTNWKVEATDESESGVLKYQGEYHIDDQGRIKVAPGNYEITRIPVSRYKFVTSATTAQYDTEPSLYTQTENIDAINIPQETVTITNLQSGKTVDVHYYDEVEYYDKFSHVDTKINQFYKLDSSKKNTTVKGISVNNIPSTSGTTATNTRTVSITAYKVFVDGTVDTTPISGSELTIEFDSSISGDFSYSNGTITIQNATTTHHQKVYTVTAKYDNNKFTTTFDIAIP